MMRDLGSQSDCIISIEEKLIRAKKEDAIKKWEEVRIYRVPRSIKCRKPDLYEPKIVSFGPYHRSNPKVREAEAHKCRALHYMLKRNNQEVAQYLDAVREQEKRARSCYEEEISLSSDQFVEMMVLDGCFLIECLLMNKYSLGYPGNIPFLNMHQILSDVFTDMLLVENQIPFFVLQVLANMQRNPVVSMLVIENNANNCFHSYISRGTRPPPPNDEEEEPFHILDMVMKNQGYDEPNVNADKGNKVKEAILRCAYKLKKGGVKFEPREAILPCASKLKIAGVKFKPREDNLVWLIEFSERTLKLPKLCFQGDIETILHNAVSYEQRHSGRTKIISYCIFMSQLIRSTKDVDHLTEAGIIQNLNGSNEELVKLFSDIKVTFILKDDCLCEVTDQIKRHYNSNKWKANLKDTCFSNPWSFISLLAVSFIIILTFTETFFTVFPRK